MPRALPGLSIILLCLLVVSSYSNTFHSPPILDDYHSFILQQDVSVKEWSSESILRLGQTVFGWARWIPMLSFALDRWVGGGSIVVFHVTNTLIHLLCLLAVVFLAYNLFQAAPEEKIGSDSLSNTMVAVLVAGLWALNPVQTNAVTYIVQRMASIQALFFILSVAFYVLGRRIQRAEGKLVRALPSFLAASIAALMAFLSKENSLMLPVMILVTETWFFTPDLLSAVWNRLLRFRKIEWGLGVFTLIGLGVLWVKAGPDLSAGYAIRHFTMMERLLTQTRIVVWYLSLLIWPVPSRLSIEHDVVLSTSLIDPPATLAATLFLLLLAWAAIRFRRQAPLITYGVAWFFLNLVIESSIVPLELVFEHRLYLPSVGWTLAVTCVLIRVFRRLLTGRTERDFAVITGCAFALLISGLSLLTFVRNEAWHSSISINLDTVLKAPNHPRAHANLAVALGSNGLYEQAIEEAEEAIRLGREHFEQDVVAVNAIVGSLVMTGNFRQAVERGEELVQKVSGKVNAAGLPMLYLNLAEAHLRLGQLREAYSATLKALDVAQQLGRSEVDPKLIQLRLTQILEESGRTGADLDEDGQSDPGGFDPETWIARMFLDRGLRDEGKRLLVEASRKHPEDEEAVRILRALEREDELNRIQLSRENSGRKYRTFPFSRFQACMTAATLLRGPAVPYPLRYVGEMALDHAVSLQPDSADAHLLKAWYLYDRRELEQAVEAARRALNLDPDYAKAHMGLGFFLLESDEPEAAAEAFKKALSLYPGCPQRKTIGQILAAIEQRRPEGEQDGLQP